MAVNDAMRLGTAMEPIARALLNEKYGTNLQPAVLQHPHFDWHISSVDGIQINEDGSCFVCEIKNPGKIDHECALAGNVPEKYLPQCYHILEDLPGVEKMLYLSYHGDSQAEIWVYRDEKKMALQLIKEQDFFYRLLNFNPPPPSDLDWVQCYGHEIESKAEKYELLKLNLEGIQAVLEELKKDLIEGIGSVSRAKIGDLKIQRVIRQGHIDYSQIEALQGLDLNPYRKAPIVSWRVG